MKKYPKIVQCDKRGQIVIPKDIRDELNVDEGTGFWLFSITDEGILLKRINDEELSPDDNMVKELKDKAYKIEMKPKNIERSVEAYKKSNRGKFEEI